MVCWLALKPLSTLLDRIPGSFQDTDPSSTAPRSLRNEISSSATRDRMLRMVAKGASYEQVVAANLTENAGIPVPAGAMTAEQFIWWMYVELTERKVAPR